jgi:DNA-binding NarL/FixJ family response regulator
MPGARRSAHQAHRETSSRAARPRRRRASRRSSLSPEVSFELAEHVADEPLTPTELRVLQLIAQGNANKEIGIQLSLSEDTVKGHIHNILSKLGAKDRTHAAMLGLKRGIISF